MSEPTPDPVVGSNDPFRPDDEAREASRQDGDNDVPVGFPLLDLDPDAQDVDRDEPGDRV